MRSAEISLKWRIAYAVGCLVYGAWVLQLSLHDFDKVHREYRQAAARLHPTRIAEIAKQELTDQCRREALRGGRFRPIEDKMETAAEASCLIQPESVLKEKIRAVEGRLLTERSRAGRKLALFYGFFVIIFLILPPVLLYLLLVFLTGIFKRIKVAK